MAATSSRLSPKQNDSSRFIICRASAGSGKTFTLVKEYLKLAFSCPRSELPNRFRRILAITFTNKAANEMKERIMEQLDAISILGCEDDMGQEIATSMNLDNQQLMDYAKIVRNSILHNYSDLSVCTIDSFMHRIVRTFAHDLNLPMKFNVHLDNSKIIQHAVDDLLSMAGTEGNGELTRVLCEFAESKMEDGKSYRIENEIAKLANELFKEDTAQYLDALKKMDSADFSSLHKQMTKENRAYEERLAAVATKALETIAHSGVSDEAFYRGKNGASGYFKRIANGESTAPNTYALDFLAGDKLGSSKANEQDLDALQSIKPLLVQFYNQIEEIREKGERLYNTRKTLQRNLYTLAVINKLNELVEQYSKDNEILHISEFNKRISAVVQEEDAPFIYERIGTRYTNFLIDEFQDTSRLQWHNLIPLTENSIASGHTSLVVGDGKQAIYRFRQGDVGQFIQLPKVDSRHGKNLESATQRLMLDTNFRSTRQIVEFNNQFFEWVIRNRYHDHDELNSIYIGGNPSSAAQERPGLWQAANNEGGYVQASFIHADSSREALWQRMLEDIRMLTEEKGYELRDITILARSNATLSQVSEFLTQAGIGVISSESFLLTQSRVVMLIITVLHYLIDTSSRLYAYQTLLYLKDLGLIRQSHDDRFTDRTPIDLEEILAGEGLRLNCERLLSLGLYDCCEEIIRMLNLDGLENAYCATLLNVVNRYENDKQQSLTDFLTWFDEQKEKLSTSTSSDANAVQLMTIHKAKGLESPIVMYPIPTSTERPDSLWVTIDESQGLGLPAGLVSLSKTTSTIFDNAYIEEKEKSEMDKINVLYVALTRPKDKLMIYCEKDISKEQKSDVRTDYSSLLYDFLSAKHPDSLGPDDTFRLGKLDDKATANALKPKRTGKKIKHEKPVQTTLESISFPSWTGRILIAEQASKIFTDSEDSRKLKGTMVHDLLSMVYHAQDLDNAARNYAQRKHLDKASIDTLKGIASNVISHPDCQRFFADGRKVLCERDLVWHGEVIRPDRVVFTPSETWVVDFKTGSPHASHLVQVQQYCQAVAAMGHPNVSGYLIYIGDEQCQVTAVPL